LEESFLIPRAYLIVGDIFLDNHFKGDVTGDFGRCQDVVDVLEGTVRGGDDSKEQILCPGEAKRDAEP
jgi:hypothetical protein